MLHYHGNSQELLNTVYVWCTRSSTSGARLRLGSSLPTNLFVCLILFNSFIALSQDCQGRRKEVGVVWDLVWVFPHCGQDYMTQLDGFSQVGQATALFLQL